MGSYKVWSEIGCPYCEKAQALLLENQLLHEVVILDHHPGLRSEITKKYAWETVPIIVEQSSDSETLVGGYTDLVTHLERSTL